MGLISMDGRGEGFFAVATVAEALGVQFCHDIRMAWRLASISVQYALDESNVYPLFYTNDLLIYLQPEFRR